MRALDGRWLTADEISDVTDASCECVRARLDELRRMGAVLPTGLKRKSKRGYVVTVWRLAA
jgi:hypothetical protein